MTLLRPDLTKTVDWSLKYNYLLAFLPAYLPTYLTCLPTCLEQILFIIQLPEWILRSKTAFNVGMESRCPGLMSRRLCWLTGGHLSVFVDAFESKKSVCWQKRQQARPISKHKSSQKSTFQLTPLGGMGGRLRNRRFKNSPLLIETKYDPDRRPKVHWTKVGFPYRYARTCAA